MPEIDLVQLGHCHKTNLLKIFFAFAVTYSDIPGLPLIATCLLIALYIRNESGYDRNYVNGDRLYRLMQNYKRDDGSINSGPAQPAPMAQAIARDFPQVELAARIMPYPLLSGAGSNQVRPQGQTNYVYEEGFTYADQRLFEMFRFPMVYGDAAHALSEPNSIVISQRKADKYFPHQDLSARCFI